MNEFTKFLDNLTIEENKAIVKEWISFKETGILNDGILRTKAQELGKIAYSDATRFTDSIAQYSMLELAKKYINESGELNVKK